MKDQRLRKSWQRAELHLRTAVAHLDDGDDSALRMCIEYLAAREWGLAFDEVVAVAAAGRGTPEAWRALTAAAEVMKIGPDTPVHGQSARVVCERIADIT